MACDGTGRAARLHDVAPDALARELIQADARRADLDEVNSEVIGRADAVATTTVFSKRWETTAAPRSLTVATSRAQPHHWRADFHPASPSRGPARTRGRRRPRRAAPPSIVLPAPSTGRRKGYTPRWRRCKTGASRQRPMTDLLNRQAGRWAGMSLPRCRAATSATRIERCSRGVGGLSDTRGACRPARRNHRRGVTKPRPG